MIRASFPPFDVAEWRPKPGDSVTVAGRGGVYGLVDIHRDTATLASPWATLITCPLADLRPLEGDA